MADCHSCDGIVANPISDLGRQRYHEEIDKIDEVFRHLVVTFSMYFELPGKSKGHAKLIFVPRTGRGVETKEGYTVELVYFYRDDSSREIRPRTKHLSPFKIEGDRHIIPIPGINFVAKLQEILVLAENIMENFESYNICCK